MRVEHIGISSLIVCLASAALSAGAGKSAAPSYSWDAKTAAAYLDNRENKWMAFPGAARDHKTFCVSCHTVLPFALSRPALRAVQGDKSISADEQKLIDNVTTRVRAWREIEPYYSDEKSGTNKTRESFGTESILNVLILANRDAETGFLSDDTQKAFDILWSLQESSGDEKGSWHWLNFANVPWEAPDSGYYGAALAAVAVGIAPHGYSSKPEIQANIQSLREYLRSQASKQSPINRIALLWASAEMRGLLSTSDQQAIVQEMISKQQSDGGWSLSGLVGPWKRHDGTALETKSDGYATGFIAYAFEQAGMARNEDHLARALAWLAANQNSSEGDWPGYSPNKSRDLSTNVGHFMSDAATAYSALALAHSQ